MLRGRVLRGRVLSVRARVECVCEGEGDFGLVGVAIWTGEGLYRHQGACGGAEWACGGT